MRDVFIVADNIISPLGSTTAQNFSRIKEGMAGVHRHDRPNMSDQPFYAALFDPATFTGGVYTKFEHMLMASIEDALLGLPLRTADPRTILIICSTKGNTYLLDEDEQTPPEAISLPASALKVARCFGFVHTPVVISNACISGLLGMITGMRLIRAGLYDHAVVAGADVITKFILSGFGSFQALSPGHCKPFDRDRDGINLGEGVATMVLSGDAAFQGKVRLSGGAVGNDANHISGPSRTGKELSDVIRRSLAEAGCATSDIGFISAHGTATPYNDEMEAKAITLAGLGDVPVNSLKGYYGHTLGAAGLIESIITHASMCEGVILPSRGYEHHGVSTPLNICESLLHVPLHACLKTASGFGGCNAAVVLQK